MAILYQYQGEGLLKTRVPVEVDEQEINDKIIAEKIKLGEEAVQRILDSKAGEYSYKLNGKGSILSACSYAGYDNPFRSESEQFLAWRGATWAFLYQFVNEITEGLKPMPETFEELVAILPKFEDFKK